MAEELCLGRISTGAEHDLSQVTRLARHMVRTYGMSERLGSMALPGEGASQSCRALQGWGDTVRLWPGSWMRR